MPTIYELRDETGIPLSYHPTIKEAQAELNWWLTQGCEPTWHYVNYIATKSGVCRLLNVIKPDAGG